MNSSPLFDPSRTRFAPPFQTSVEPAPPSSPPRRLSLAWPLLFLSLIAFAWLWFSTTARDARAIADQTTLETQLPRDWFGARILATGGERFRVRLEVFRYLDATRLLSFTIDHPSGTCWMVELERGRAPANRFGEFDQARQLILGADDHWTHPHLFTHDELLLIRRWVHELREAARRTFN